MSPEEAPELLTPTPDRHSVLFLGRDSQASWLFQKPWREHSRNKNSSLEGRLPSTFLGLLAPAVQVPVPKCFLWPPLPWDLLSSQTALLVCGALSSFLVTTCIPHTRTGALGVCVALLVRTFWVLVPGSHPPPP